MAITWYNKFFAKLKIEVAASWSTSRPLPFAIKSHSPTSTALQQKVCWLILLHLYRHIQLNIWNHPQYLILTLSQFDYLLGSVYITFDPSQHTHANMAEGAQAVPTFKLVLVGDGGTGKVRLSSQASLSYRSGWRSTGSVDLHSSNHTTGIMGSLPKTID